MSSQPPNGYGVDSLLTHSASGQLGCGSSAEIYTVSALVFGRIATQDRTNGPGGTPVPANELAEVLGCRMNPKRDAVGVHNRDDLQLVLYINQGLDQSQQHLADRRIFGVGHDGAFRITARQLFHQRRF